MHAHRAGEVAVIFWSRRNGRDAAGYAEAAAAMAARAATREGYRGVEDARDAGGVGVTVSYWADEAAALAWRDDPEHAAIRAAGRERWYEAYSVTVARVERGYAWRRGDGTGAGDNASPAKAGAQSGAQAWTPACAGEGPRPSGEAA